MEYSTTGGETGVAAASGAAQSSRSGAKRLTGPPNRHTRPARRCSIERAQSSPRRSVESIESVAMPTAFLTGGTGFVGGHVARALLEEGWGVRVLARDAS